MLGIYPRQSRIGVSKDEGKFTRMVSEGRGKPRLVVNNEISKDGDLCKRVEGQNVLHFGS
ncbi:hypothetical protein E2C01_054065 [Portunus trituberculatus]|uniref:Uncharacterized protein n=1 Tax=Portunus trituberculatus TaxID=210409 RepID=A0A5B7GIW2_PORTR|nr:hypothetical protein [Portunus trituberculatus]